MMDHTKTIKREDGTRINICVSISISSYSPVFWRLEVYMCLPKKRKFYNVHDSNSDQYRRLDTKEREAHILNEQLCFVTKEEMLQAKTEIWEKLKPTLP